MKIPLNGKGFLVRSGNGNKLMGMAEAYFKPEKFPFKVN